MTKLLKSKVDQVEVIKRSEKWREGSGLPSNQILDQEGYTISYNPCTFDQGRKETAIIVEVDGRTRYYILYGDHRRTYEKMSTLKEALMYYVRNPKKFGYTTNELAPEHKLLIQEENAAS